MEELPEYRKQMRVSDRATWERVVLLGKRRGMILDVLAAWKAAEEGWLKERAELCDKIEDLADTISGLMWDYDKTGG